jgi:hypothetical protein
MMEAKTCNKCSYAHRGKCIHPKAKQGKRPFPKCEGDLWRK